ncbi:PAS domain S-box protein [candidate division KSB1 bacterium]|nr:PAS domain S-box protein [candidate division KSB1 bacterium]
MNPYKILIFEDESIIAMELKRKLEQIGYVIPAIESFGEKAIEMVDRHDPDLILMDIMLEGQVDGVQAATRIREKKDIPLVFLTAYSDDCTIQRVKQIEPYGYILKPFDEREIKTVIELALYKHSMQKKIKENEQWLSATLRSIGDAVVTTSTDGVVTYINPVAESLTGWKKEDVMGQSVAEILIMLDADTRETIQDPLQEAVPPENKDNQSSNRILISKTGEEIFVDVSCSPILTGHQESNGVVFTFRDMTRRRQMESALRQSEEKFRSLVENSQTGILIIDKSFQVLYSNEEVSRIFGYTREDIINHDFRDFLKGSSKAELVDRHLRRQKGESIPTRYTMEMISKNGEMKKVEVTSSIIEDKFGNAQTVVQILDITQRIQLEEQLRQAQKMKAIGTLAGGIAHDFNNILTAIRGCTDMALKEVSESHAVHAELIEVQTSAERAADLTRQLLAFSRNQPLQYKYINLNKIIESLLKMLHRLIGEDIGVSTSLEENIWIVKADQGSIEEVLMNLGVNAQDAMPKGGKLHISTRNITLDETYCENMPEARPGHYVCLSIADTGLGMNKETVRRIFEPFFSTKGTGKGTGLGLSVVYGIIKQHEGWINVYSEPSKGSIFRIYLERADGDVFETDVKEVVERYQGKGEHLLVVEDEEKVRLLSSKALSKYGYQVTSVSSIDEAIQAYNENPNKFDLLFSDVVLTDGTGLDLIDQLQPIWKNLKVLLCSGYTDQKSQWPLIQEHGYPFLPKPFTLIELLKKVNFALHGKDESEKSEN